MQYLEVYYSFIIAFEQVTIAPRAGRELGYVRMKMNHLKFKEGLLRYVLLKPVVSLHFLKLLLTLSRKPKIVHNIL